MTMSVKRWILITVSFALAVWMTSCMHPAYAQEPSTVSHADLVDSQVSYGALEMRMLELRAQYRGATDATFGDELGIEIANIRRILWARDLAALRTNDAAIEILSEQMRQSAALAEAASYKKWCQRTVWRRLRRYREPVWCSR